MMTYDLFRSVLVLSLTLRTLAFVVSTPRAAQSTRLAAMRVDLATLSDIGYEVTVEKPLGVVFGENRAPFNGLCIDTIADGSNGAAAGFKLGDQLLAVNGQCVIGADFDEAMDALRNADSPVELKMYKGVVSSLFTIVMNRRTDDDGDLFEEEEEADDVVFDDSYETPVVMTFDENDDDDKISISAVAGDAVKGLGTMFGKSFGSMFSKDSIQMDDKDARGY